MEMEPETEKTNLQIAIDILINIVGMIMVVYTTAYFFIALTD